MQMHIHGEYIITMIMSTVSADWNEISVTAMNSANYTQHCSK